MVSPTPIFTPTQNFRMGPDLEIGSLRVRLAQMR